MVGTAYHAVARAATATASFIKHHAAAIASFVVSAVVFVGCEAVLTGASGGARTVPGAIVCGALAGAVGGAVSYGITAAQTGKFSLAGLAESAGVGALAGGLTGGLVKGGGAVLGGLLRSGATDAASSLASSAANEAANAATADSTGTAAAQDVTARAADEVGAGGRGRRAAG